MKIKHTYIDNKIVIMIEPKDAQEEREIIKRIEFAELCAEQPKKKDEEKERWDID